MPLDFWIKDIEGEGPVAQLHFRELDPLISVSQRLNCVLMRRLYEFYGADADVEFTPGELHSLIEEAVGIRDRCKDNTELTRFLTDLIDAAGRAAGKKSILYTRAD